MNIRNLAATASVLSLLLAACKQDEGNDPQPQPAIMRFAMYDSNYVHSGYSVDSLNQIHFFTVVDTHRALTRVDTFRIDSGSSPSKLIYKGDTFLRSSSGSYDYNGRAPHSNPQGSQTFVKFRGDTVIVNHLINAMQTQSQQAFVRGLKTP